VRSRCEGRLTHPNADTAKQEHGVSGRQSAGGGGDTPHRNTARGDPHASALVDQPTQRQAGQGQKNCKEQTLQKADFRVAQMQILFERLDQNTQDLPINEGQDAEQPVGAAVPRL